MPKLLLATNNKGKIEEYKALLQGIPYQVVTPADEGINITVSETGSSMEENARLKAIACAHESRLLALADDSGLEVDALGGAPGMLSARYAGDYASDSDRIDYLLSQLNGIPWEKRTAKFRCVIAIATPDGKVETCSGECPGFITFEPKGNLGFGYDPVFYLPEFDKTMAELSEEEKNRVSHRGRAAEKAKELVKELARKEVF